jgi:hypothetical protein
MCAVSIAGRGPRATSRVFDRVNLKMATAQPTSLAENGHNALDLGAMHPSGMPDLGGAAGAQLNRTEEASAPDGAKFSNKSLISRAAFAKLAGVSKAAITQHCRKLLVPARVGRRIDVLHPAAVRYLAHRGVTTEQRDAQRSQAAHFPAGLTKFVREVRARVGAGELDDDDGLDPVERATRAAARAFIDWSERRGDSSGRPAANEGLL